jgi:metallo-beta-lactamase class B
MYSSPRWFKAAMLSVLLLAMGGQGWIRAQQAVPFDPDWVKPFPAFHMIGNIYWVGTWDLATYLITTPEGHILINSGYKQTVPEIISGIESLGFRPTDVKWLLATHGHFDHVAGLAELQRITHAKVAMSRADAELLESGGKKDFLFGQNPDAWFDPVRVDRQLDDGDKVVLGGVELTAHLHPGHTKGATSFTMLLEEGGKTYRVGIINLGSINAGVNITGMPGFPGIEAAYRQTFRDQKALEIDVFLASHASQFDLHRKYQPGDPYDPARFVDPEGYRAAVGRMEASFERAVQRARAEQAAKP